MFDEACRRVEQSDEVQALVGDPVACAPIEQTEWLGGQVGRELEFKFKISGPQGSGEVHVVAAATDHDLEITGIEVTGPLGQTINLPPAP